MMAVTFRRLAGLDRLRYAGAWVLVALVLAPSACAHSEPVVLSVTGMDCAECFGEIETELAKTPGVVDSKFDRVAIEITVRVKPGTAPETLLAAVRRAGFDASVGAGKGAWLPLPAMPSGADARVLVKGGVDVPDLGRHLVPGKITIFDFYADWCGPCRQVDEHVAGILASRFDVAYRKLDVADWDSPLARRHLQGVANLPYVVVYGKGGRRVSAITGLDLAAIDAAVKAAGD